MTLSRRLCRNLLLISFLALSGNSFLHAPPAPAIRRHVVYDKRGRNSCQRAWTSILHGSRQYVPDGLTPEEYSQIKKKEREKLAKMDFGAFGPRFRRDERPGGDWFLMRSLWTSGFQLNASTSTSRRSDDGPMARLWSRMWHNGLPFVLSRMLLEVMFASAAMVRASSSPTMPAVVGESLQFLFGGLAYKSGSLFWKWQGLNVALACAFTVPAKKFLAHANRRWLWSHKKTVVTTIAAAVVSHVLLGVFLALLQ